MDTATQVEVVGVHPITAREPCHLLELLVTNARHIFALGDFTQEWPGKPRSSWQVAYMDRVLNPTGSKILGGTRQVLENVPELLDGSIRLVFGKL